MPRNLIWVKIWILVGVRSDRPMHGMRCGPQKVGQTEVVEKKLIINFKIRYSIGQMAI